MSVSECECECPLRNMPFIPYLNLVRVNFLRYSDGSPFQRTARGINKAMLKIITPRFGYLQGVPRVANTARKITSGEQILHVGGC